MLGADVGKVPPLTIRGVNTFAVEVPMTFPLGTSAAIVKKAPLLLVDLETEDGITGRSYVFCYRSSVPRAIDVVLRDAVSLVTGEPAIPFEIAAKLSRRFALVGVSSLVRMALSALDIAIWDALAVAARMPTREIARRNAQADPRLQFERARLDVAGGCRRRGREATRRRFPKREAAPGPSDTQAGSCGNPRCAQAATRLDGTTG